MTLKNIVPEIEGTEHRTPHSINHKVY